jgi:hypothetical protein
MLRAKYIAIFVTKFLAKKIGTMGVAHSTALRVSNCAVAPAGACNRAKRSAQALITLAHSYSTFCSGSSSASSGTTPETELEGKVCRGWL